MNPLRIGLFGAAPDTSNMGVSALYTSFLSAMERRLPEGTEVVVFDNGVRRSSDDAAFSPKALSVIRFGARGGVRVYRPDNLIAMSAFSRLGRMGRIHPGVRMIESCSALLDVSAGDSFSDIYGMKRFRNILRPKEMCVRRHLPILLLPQTYGPYFSRRAADAASAVLRDVDQAWARDAASFDVLKRLIGTSFDPCRHLDGVDMAFGLPPEDAMQKIPDLADWLSAPKELIGINISGLIWTLAEAESGSIRFNADYQALMEQAVRWLLETTDANVLLIPHVLVETGHRESDYSASKELYRRIQGAPGFEARLRIAPGTLNERELKWLIGQCSWFCGTRMHSTIAGLASGVPTASVVYSDKASGVFATCGQANQIVDPRQLSTEQALDRLRECFDNRDSVRAGLGETLPDVLARLNTQMDRVADFVIQVST